MKSSIAFTKMHGLGNDFVVINALTHPLDLSLIHISTLANRMTGIGFDQLLIIETDKDADFFCRIFNSDGSEAAQCGNGLRCIARYVHEEKLISKKDFTIRTLSGIYPIHIQDYDNISVTLNNPLIEDLSFPLTLQNKSTNLSLINVGNPHAILRVDDLQNTDIQALTQTILNHPHFIDGINIGFLQILNEHQAKLRTIERGAGETLACGSNAAASAYAALQNKWLTKMPIEILYPLGTLTITLTNNHLTLTGSASRSFEGTLKS